MPEDRIEYNGTTFYRDERGYYGAGGDDRERGVAWLHREVWRDHHGEIPEGHVVHHIDGDPSNNDIDNLELLTYAEHAERHPDWGGDGVSDAALEAAKEWHASDEGREWHARHWHESLGKAFEETEATCDQCGEAFVDRTSHDGARFCSKACKAKWRREQGLDDEERECPVCGETFTVNKYKDTKTCSRSCGAKLRWQD